MVDIAVVTLKTGDAVQAAEVGDNPLELPPWVGHFPAFAEICPVMDATVKFRLRLFAAMVPLTRVTVTRMRFPCRLSVTETCEPLAAAAGAAIAIATTGAAHAAPLANVRRLIGGDA